MGIKISLIGAGSAIFSLNLIKDLCLTENLRHSTISFMDIDQDRLEAAYTLCERYAAETGLALTLEKTGDRATSLQGADFVINTALASGYDHLREGWQIARKHGYTFGGSHQIVHDEAFWINFYQMRLMEDIYRDMLEICPAAWYIIVANPVKTGITYLTRKYPGAKIVGMCHGYAGVYHLAASLGFQREEIAYEIPGVNHFVWLTGFHINGRNGYEILDQVLAEMPAAEQAKKFGKKALDLYRRFGIFPIGDTGSPGGGAWGYWYHTGRELEQQWGEDPWGWYDWYFDYAGNQVQRIREAAYNPSVKIADAFPGQRSDEPMIPLIEALACGIERVITVNIPNTGSLVPGVPEDFEVEVKAMVSSRGIQGIRTNGLPRPVLAFLLRDMVAPAEMEIEAFIKGDRSLLLNVILMDPWTRSLAQAESLLEEILALPYHEEMRRHYR